MSNTRIGFIGAGRWANEVHYPVLFTFPDVAIAAICDIDQTKLQQTAERYNVPAAFTSYASMLDDVALDAVYIVMPPHMLFDAVVDCLKCGLNVFIEKPPGVSLEQTKSFARLAEKHKCLTMVGFNRRFMPALMEARRLVEQRGSITHCAATYYKHYLVDAPYFDGPATMLTLDGIHAVDTLRWLGGNIESVDSHVRTWQRPYPNAFHALIRFEGGSTGFLSTDWSAGRRLQTLEMHTEGISVFVDIDNNVIIHRDDSAEPEVIGVREIAGSDDFNVYYGFVNENRHFIDCIKSGEIPSTNFDEAVRTMELVDTIEHGDRCL